MRASMYALVLCLTVATHLACSSTSSRNPGDSHSSKSAGHVADSASVSALTQSVNAFACDLYRELTSTRGNLTCSPFSVSAAMGLTCAGASGKTRDEMRSVLHLTSDDMQPFEGYRSLFAHLDASAKAGGSRWILANRIWVQSGTPLLPAFTQTARQSFRSEVGELDIQRAPEAARESMNRWVEAKTENRIRDLFPQGSIDAMTRLVLANAIYFKGRWSEPFDKDQTRLEPFHLTAKSVTTTQMMFLTHHFAFARIKGARVLELPYQGEQLSMLILLPDAIDGLSSLESRMSEDSLRIWTSSLGSREVRVGLPRFTATSQFTLSQTLAALGMPSAFDDKEADFSGMTGTRGLFISLVVHKAFVDVNEEGTEAAAATGAVATVSTRAFEVPEEFLADRPFLFLIRDRASGCILFLGRLADPAV
jgi:serpin B